MLNFNQIEFCMRMQVKKWGVFEHFYAPIFQLWCRNLGPKSNLKLLCKIWCAQSIWASLNIQATSSWILQQFWE
jgi:hypothetical protein